jgi:hypothetical protein
MVADGPMDGEMFRAYVDRCLVPVLRPGDIVILDNLSSHKVRGVREAIAAAGARLLYLPPYSPDLNPIEKFLTLRRCSGCARNGPQAIQRKGFLITYRKLKPRRNKADSA